MKMTKEEIKKKRKIDPEKSRLYTRRYVQKYPERVRESSRKYLRNNREKLNKSQRERYQINKKEIIRVVQEKQKENNYAYEKTFEQRTIRNIKRRTRYWFPLKNKECEFCPFTATEHHHNIKPIEFDKFNYVCRDCHIKCDETLKGGIKT